MTGAMSVPWSHSVEGRVSLPPSAVRRILLFVGLLAGAFLVLVVGSSTARADDGPLGSADLPATGVVDDVAADVSTVVDPAPKPVAEAVAPVVQPVADAVEPVAEVVAPVVAPVVQPVAEVVAPVVQPVARPVVDPVVDVAAPVVDAVSRSAPAIEPSTPATPRPAAVVVPMPVAPAPAPAAQPTAVDVPGTAPWATPPIAPAPVAPAPASSSSTSGTGSTTSPVAVLSADPPNPGGGAIPLDVSISDSVGGTSRAPGCSPD
jgi:hypothetical protein